MKLLKNHLKSSLMQFRASQTLGPIFVAIVVGVGAGLLAVAFHYLIHFTRWFVAAGLGSFWGITVRDVAIMIPVMAAAGLFCGLVIRFLAPETKGDGVPEVMSASIYQGSRMRPLTVIYKMLTSAFCIGSGAAAGPDGPNAQIGAAWGSSLAQMLRLPDRRIPISAACGAAAGIAATFNAPLGGVLFALEVILGRFTATTFGLVALSAASASAVSSRLVGDYSGYAVFVLTDSPNALHSEWEIALYAGLGICCALVALVCSKSLYTVEDVAARIKIPEYAGPAIGMALAGAVVLLAMTVTGDLAPATLLGLGAEHAGQQPFDPATSPFTTLNLLVLCVAAIAAMAFTIGSGGSGGVIAPMLVIGALFGAAFGSIAQHILPGLGIEPRVYALAGMAGVFAGAARAPITATLLVIELTGKPSLALPLAIVAVLSAMVAQRISPESIYTLSLRRRGMKHDAPQDVNPMDAVTVSDAMARTFESVPADMPLTALVMKLATGHETGYPVIDKQGLLTGVVTAQDVENARVDRNPDELVVADICTRNVVVCRPDQTLSSALAQFGAHDIGRLPVIDVEHPDHVIGMLHRSSVIDAYSDAYNQGVGLAKQADVLSARTENSESTVVEETITAGSMLAGERVRDAGFPPGSVLVTVRRADTIIIPRGSTKLDAGDVISVLSTRENARELRRWLKENC